MDLDEKKKVLFVVGMEHKMENLIKQKTNIKPESILILQSYEPVISPFGDLMRDIIYVVFEEKVEEIIVVATKYEQKYPLNILNKICENKELQEKVQTLDYLFKHSMPEFPKGNISVWLESNKTWSDHVQNNVNVIRNHPLMPSDVKVMELFIEIENEKRSEIGTC
ncbi:carbonic anhydrase [Bacillus sp. EB600]|uniref:carbonic anhydrase n=1 Tax=Bacillus sp. EB600 TaxID=2806345 RepID=UPI00210898E8|nr:carbonic anhydrase [Bacillus sp. EB600]MCQ6279405.1 carbonic anhydrase [Bacillus sp. EB600]